jgi:hypothetical protein
MLDISDAMATKAPPAGAIMGDAQHAPPFRVQLANPKSRMIKLGLTRRCLSSDALVSGDNYFFLGIEGRRQVAYNRLTSILTVGEFAGSDTGAGNARPL